MRRDTEPIVLIWRGMVEGMPLTDRAINRGEARIAAANTIFACAMARAIVVTA
jgi:hypothetical protein